MDLFSLYEAYLCVGFVNYTVSLLLTCRDISWPITVSVVGRNYSSYRYPVVFVVVGMYVLLRYVISISETIHVHYLLESELCQDVAEILICLYIFCIYSRAFLTL